MSFPLLVNGIALLFSCFVVGVLFGAIFSRHFREKVVTFLHLDHLFLNHLLLDKSSHNPILRPGTNPWTAEAVLNPAALVLLGRTHLVYRAVGMDGVSRLGYASSEDGITIDQQLPYPVYVARNPRTVAPHLRRYSPVIYPSGGSWGGCEDPRMVLIDERVYVTFNMFENWALRVAVIAMSQEDFLAHRFTAWEGPTILSHGTRDKNWMLFPEKIDGKFAVLHSIIGDDADHVRIEFVDDLAAMSQMRFASPDPHQVPNNQIAWHYRMRSAGPPPLKTDRGWLVFYHAMDPKEPNRYKLGAMLLDLNDPTHITHRANAPVLSPDEAYENDGKPGIVYACGAVVRDGTLFVYYGGADKVICVATVSLDTFLTALTQGGEPTLTTIQPTQTA
jgi:predicted GH43/DUF377 family glycosyl hydrolase